MLPRIAALLLLPAAATAARFENDFSDYPSGARSCLESADGDSGCDGETVATMNACLCDDVGDFVTSTAKCVGKGSPDDLEETYALLKVNCDGTNSDLSVSKEDFISIGEDSDSGPADPEDPDPEDPDPADPEDPDPPKGGRRSGLSTGGMIGVAVGAAVLVVALAAGIFYLIRRRRRARRAKDEANPMLGGAGERTSLPPSALTRDSAYVPPYQDSEAAKTPSGVGAWGPESFHGVSPSPGPPMQQAPVHAGGNEVFELASTERVAAEMPGSVPQSRRG